MCIRDRGHDDDEGGAQVGVAREPALDGAHGGRIAALADAVRHQPDDEDRADGPERVPEPSAAVWLQWRLVPEVGGRRHRHERNRRLEPAKARVLEDRVVPHLDAFYFWSSIV